MDELIKSDVHRKLDALQSNPEKVLLQFYCPNHCSCEMHMIKFPDYNQEEIPVCCNCGHKLEYAGTLIQK